MWMPSLEGWPCRRCKTWKLDTLNALEKHAAPLRAQGLPVESSCDWDFPAYEAVVRRAARSGADLIVAERHATRHVLPWLLRFNDWELLRRSPVPVLLIKRAQAWKRPVVSRPSVAYLKPAGLDPTSWGRQCTGHRSGNCMWCMRFRRNDAHDRIGVLPPDVASRMKRQLETDARKAFSSELADLNVALRVATSSVVTVDVVPGSQEGTRIDYRHGRDLALRTQAAGDRKHRRTGARRPALRRAGAEAGDLPHEGEEQGSRRQADRHANVWLKPRAAK
jgi:hypothetical protein